MFGCGEPTGPDAVGFLRSDATRRDQRHANHRLTRLDVLAGPRLEQLLELRAAGVLGIAAVLAPVLGALGLGMVPRGEPGHGREHSVPSMPETVRLGVFDSDAPDVLQIDSGDSLVYPNTWSHFLNRMQPGVSIEDLARLRRENPGRGPHSIVGPVSVRGAEPGDMLAIHFLELEAMDWGASFVNPADLGTGSLPGDFPRGQVRYLSIDRQARRAEFLPGIHVPIAPFQGTFGVAPAQGGVVSSVPPGQHAGNIDLRELTVGSTLYVPVWQMGGKMFTGDSHATQGDGEVNNQALESAMRRVRIRVVLHKRPGWTWPFAETDSHWIAMATHPDLDVAFGQAVRNTLEFLQRKAGLSALDAYSLASIGVHFRVTQFVNQTRGVHAMIPKALFAPDRLATMSIV